MDSPYSTAKLGWYGKVTHLLINKYGRDHQGERQYVGFMVICRPAETNVDAFHDFTTLDEAKADANCGPCGKAIAKVEATFITLFKEVGGGEIDVTLCPEHHRTTGALFGLLSGSSDDDGRSLATLTCEVCQRNGDGGFIGLLAEKIGREIEAHAER